MENKNGILFWVGEGGCYSCAYGCDWFCKVEDTKELYEYLEAAEELHDYDKYVIHFDGLHMDILEEMVAKGKNTNKYEVRIHGVDKEQYNLFWDYVNKHWTDQTGWFKRKPNEFIGGY